MSWLGDILKHLELSKKFTAALFVSTLAVLVAPTIFPASLDAVPDQWRWLVAGACIFSGTLLIIWAAPPIWRFISSIPGWIRNNPRINAPTGDENGFLLFLGENFPNDVANLDNLRHDKASKLEVLEMCYGLQRKGLVRVNPFNDNLVNLTPAGRKYALQLMQAKA